MTSPIHVIGGGLAGLVAALTAAERGAPVVLHEAGDHLGGRAVGDHGRRLNLGPHVVLTDGPVVHWLNKRQLLPPLGRAVVGNVRFVTDGGVRSTPSLPLTAGIVRHVRDQAPVDERFRDWSVATFGARQGDQLCRLAGLFTFHHDPGRFSARFVWDRFGRYLRRPDHVRSILGGWSTLVDALAERAGALGVRIELGAAVEPGWLPDDGPVIVATSMPVAARLLGEPLDWPGARTALVDLALPASPGLPNLVMDTDHLTTCCFLDRITAADAGAASHGEDLFQAQLGVPGGASDDEAAFRRIDQTLDASLPRWRELLSWRADRVVQGASGALDPPGTTWRDRPGIRRSAGVYLAGDMTASPGLLSEVSVNSAVRAAHLALDDRRARSFSVRWPVATLTPERRVNVLAATLPGAAVRSTMVDRSLAAAWPIEPEAEVEPWVSVDAGRRLVRVQGATEDDGQTRLTALVAGRGRLARLLGPRLGRLLGRTARRQLQKLARSSR